VITEHMWLVEVIASKWARGDYQLRDDFIGAGNEWLVKAAANFDESRDAKFAAYAVHYIRAGIMECIREMKGVTRLPQRCFNLKPKVDALLDAGKSVDEIVAELGCAGHMVMSIKYLARSVPDGEESLPYVASGYGEPEREYLASHTLVEIKNKLSKRGWFVMMERADGKSCKQIGDNLGLTSEAIRQEELKSREIIKNQ